MTTTRATIVLARPGCKATIKIVEGTGGHEYTDKLLRGDAATLVAALRVTLPVSTFVILAHLMEAQAKVMEKRTEGKESS